MELFPFQQETVDKYKDQRGVLIAHDMGLGKTVTAIALDIEKRKRFAQPTKTLVICPLSVLNVWKKHFNDWAPELNVTVINNKNRKPFMEMMSGTFNNAFGVGYDVFIMHYPAMRLEPDVSRYPWFHVICDEVHGLQNKDAAQTKAVKKIKAFYKTGLSGTPVFNKPDDLWSILNWLYPKYWPSYWNYFNRYINWVDWDGYKTIIGVKNEEDLQEKMRPFYSSIKKESVLKDLPDKYFSEIKVQLGPKQQKAYKQMKKDMLAWVGEHEDDPINAPAVIAQLVRLQQFASAYAEIERYVDKYDEEKIRVTLSDPSCKIDAAMEIIKSMDEQVVVFSMFSQMAKLMAKRCEAEGITCGLFTGDQTKAERDKVIEDFQNGKLKVFAGSIKAGGVGITLTAASTVIMLNREWAQSLNDQAIDRCHRIGQKNAVHVIDIVSEGTIDEERNLSIARSWAVVKQLLGENDGR